MHCTYARCRSAGARGFVHRPCHLRAFVRRLRTRGARSRTRVLTARAACVAAAATRTSARRIKARASLRLARGASISGGPRAGRLGAQLRRNALLRELRICIGVRLQYEYCIRALVCENALCTCTCTAYERNWEMWNVLNDSPRKMYELFMPTAMHLRMRHAGQ